MAFHLQPNEGYFVESAEPTTRHHPELAEMIARRRRQAMADELTKQLCDEYLADIVNHMSVMESETLADVASIDIQQEIQWFMRPYLIDFLVEAHAAFQLLPETLFLAVNLLDRYCSRRVVYKRHYQLVGCASLLIAAKYGDRKERVPMIKELKSMCCSLYEEDMFTQMEWHVLNTLEWVVGHPTVDRWMLLALKDSVTDVEVEHMALYLCEIALYHRDFVSSKPSVMAHSSLALARGILGRPDVDNHDHHENVTLLHLSQKLAKPSQVLQRKYASPVMSRVAVTLENFLRQQELLARQNAPPSPPCEIKTQNLADFPGTPQKPVYSTTINGYMTPPITPEGEYFANGNEIKGYHPQAPRCPVTPTPAQQGFGQPTPAQQQAYVQSTYPTYNNIMRP